MWPISPMRRRSRPCASAIRMVYSGFIMAWDCRPKAYWNPASLPDRIFLYRMPILSYAYRNGEPVDRVIRHVLIHEIGHHFGFSDAGMALIESDT